MKKQKVFVGMSGGVDSSVSVAILKERGFDVTGVFIKVWQPDFAENFSGCNWREDRLDAMRVAVKLDIPFITLDLEKEYKKEVVDYMISEYKNGRTPNPDIMCNKYVKFGGFFDWAIQNGADFVATGHYAKIKEESGIFKLIAGDDKNKDQSYFLWTLNQKHLSKTIFPVGDMEKKDVRKLAQKYDLPNAVKKDSQGLCFMGKIDLKDFLSHYIENKKGIVFDESMNEIGEHNGAFLLTIGERHGFTKNIKTPEDKPLYVIKRNIEENYIVVSETFNQESHSAKKEVFIEKENWTVAPPSKEKKYKARIRYRQELENCTIDGNRVVFDNPQNIAIGQSIVFYDNDECIGGAILI